MGTAVEESGNLGDYTVHYGGTGEIHNFRYDDLILEKVLLGAAADPDKEFHFTAEFEYQRVCLMGNPTPIKFPKAMVSPHRKLEPFPAGVVKLS